jgi:diadenosine tetraphosphatase ApaH/serine/threonine PP2A family protein phosphatase
MPYVLRHRDDLRQLLSAVSCHEVRLTMQYQRIAVFGGIYNNHLALATAIGDARQRGAEALFCLGDLGGFGPHPDRVYPLLQENGVQVMRGNYDISLAAGLEDCGCGYTDPRDNYFAEISYNYTFQQTSDIHKRWLATLPDALRVQLGRYRLHMCHGSPRQVNEFLWASTTPDCLLEKFCQDYQTDAVLCTHTGIKWHRELPHDRHCINVGVLGRPENTGETHVWYTLLTADPVLQVDFIPVHYDYQALAQEMRQEGLPEEFVETIVSGWWTTCLEVLPGKERAQGRW